MLWRQSLPRALGKGEGQHALSLRPLARPLLVIA